MTNTFILKRTVSATEIDRLQHVNNTVYLQWVQDISEKHWEHLTRNNPQEKYIWVIIRHEIDYIKPAVLGDTITLKTWVGETKGVKSMRHVEILKNDTLLAKAQTTWCLLEAKTKHPTRISAEIIDLLL